MKFSYSNISTFSQCPYRWYLQYKLRLKTLPDTDPGNALWLGLALHKGIEEGVREGIEEYKSHYHLLTDEHINWIIQLEYQLPRVLEILPEGGEHELKIDLPNYVGFVDYVHGDTLYDFKFSNNIDTYKESPQLSIYKYYLEKSRPDIKINHLKYIMVPKVMIRQKKTETIQQFRMRLHEHLKDSEISVIDVEYREDSITQFEDCCKYLLTCKEFPKNETRLCNWCQFKEYCESDGQIDYMIMKN